MIKGEKALMFTGWTLFAALFTSVLLAITSPFHPGWREGAQSAAATAASGLLLWVVAAAALSIAKWPLLSRRFRALFCLNIVVAGAIVYEMVTGYIVS